MYCFSCGLDLKISLVLMQINPANSKSSDVFAFYSGENAHQSNFLLKTTSTGPIHVNIHAYVGCWVKRDFQIHFLLRQ